MSIFEVKKSPAPLARCAQGLLVALLLAMAGCSLDQGLPPYARVPYEPFSRATVVAIALREWRLFGSQVAPVETMAKAERADGLWQRVGDYWWQGVGPFDNAAAWTGKHEAAGRIFPPERDEAFAWSAAFVSYVMRMAGAGTGFPYSASHDAYIRAGLPSGAAAQRGLVIVTERPESAVPRPGDLICAGRGGFAGLRFDDLPTTPLFKAHCDIVVETGDPAGLAVIGGNVGDAVAMRHIPVTADGHLSPTEPWLAILRLRDERGMTEGELDLRPAS